MEENKKELMATYDKDSKRYHRYNIDEGQEITGSLYVPKSMETKGLVLTIKLRAKE